MTPTALADAWRRRADELRPYTSAAATAYETAAAELEAALREQADEPLTLRQASAESGYSSRRLREMVADGSIAQAGERGRPRIRRADLPRRTRSKANGSYDPAADAARILGGG